MSPPDPDQSAQKPAFSWESVVGGDDTGEESTTDDIDATALAPISLTIAPLSLEPLPPVPESPTREESIEPTPPLLGDLHVGLPSIADDEPPIMAPSPPEPLVAPVTPTQTAPPPVAPPAPVEPTPPADAAVPSVPAPAAPPAVSEPVAGGDSYEPTISTTGGGYAPRPPAVPVPDADVDVDDDDDDDDDIQDDAGEREVRISPLDVPDSSPTGAAATVDASTDGGAGAPAVVEQHDATTLIPTTQPSQAASPALPGATPAASPSIPNHQPNQAAGPRLHPNAATVVAEPATLSKKERKKQQKQKQHQLKAANKQSSGRGGFALFFTLLVLVGLIVAAIIFGQPYLFPDDWDAASRPYGEAVEAVSGEPFGEAVAVMRHAEGTYSVAMADELVQGWEEQVPMWRSFGLVDGAVDTAVLRETLDGWTPAFYSPSVGDVFVNDALTPAAVDGAIVAAMAAADLDQRNGWSTGLDDATLDQSALTRAQVIAAAADVAAASSFGPALSERRPDKAEFLPPILSYRVNAPYVFAEVVPSGDLADVAATVALPLSLEPELVAGGTIVAPQQQMDRGFWYTVFAAYTDGPTAYAASNALVEASLASVDRAGTVCSYGTFSGTDVAGTERVTGVLQQWVANAPAEMTAASTVLADGTLQLSTCDPGAAVSAGARFGIASELARWRLVELAAIESVDPVTGTAADRAAAVAQVRESQVAIALMGLPFDTTAADLATAARQLVPPAATAPAEQPGEQVEGSQPEEIVEPAD